MHQRRRQTFIIPIIFLIITLKVFLCGHQHGSGIHTDFVGMDRLDFTGKQEVNHQGQCLSVRARSPGVVQPPRSVPSVMGFQYGVLLLFLFVSPGYLDLC